MDENRETLQSIYPAAADVQRLAMLIAVDAGYADRRSVSRDRVRDLASAGDRIRELAMRLS